MLEEAQNISLYNAFTCFNWKCNILLKLAKTTVLVHAVSVLKFLSIVKLRFQIGKKKGEKRVRYRGDCLQKLLGPLPHSRENGVEGII